MSDRLLPVMCTAHVLHPENELSPQLNFGEVTICRFEKFTHVLWHCKHHIVWVPKYRSRVLKGDVDREVYNFFQVYAGRKGCQVVELNVQPKHVHLLDKIPPKVSVSKLVGVLKGKSELWIFTRFLLLRRKPY